MQTPDAPGEETAGIDLGINVFAAIAYSIEESALYPGNALKEANYYFAKEIANCDDSSSRRATRLHRKWSERRQHFVHGWTRHVAEECERLGVGDVYVGDVSGIREDLDGDAKNWGKHGNLDLHSWPFEKAPNVLEYKLKARGITVHRDPERDTSKTCLCCGRKRKANRVERGLYDCDRCSVVVHSDVGGAECIRLGVGREAEEQRDEEGVTESRSNSESPLVADGGDRSTGWLAQPAFYLYDLSRGFSPRSEVVGC